MYDMSLARIGELVGEAIYNSLRHKKNVLLDFTAARKRHKTLKSHIFKKYNDHSTEVISYTKK